MSGGTRRKSRDGQRLYAEKMRRLLRPSPEQPGQSRGGTRQEHVSSIMATLQKNFSLPAERITVTPDGGKDVISFYLPRERREAIRALAAERPPVGVLVRHSFKGKGNRDRHKLEIG